MRNIIYYVATSLDGYISGPEGDISGFVNKGNGLDQYLKDLQDFDTVIMGRKTYEFGYDYGLKPGALAYPHMTNYIYSNSLVLENKADDLHIKNIDIQHIKNLRVQGESAIYLCGGGEYAGWLLGHRQITHLKIKLNPFIAGEGVRLFGSSTAFYRTELLDSQSFEQGLQILTYRLVY